MTKDVSPRYQRVLDCVQVEPGTATDIYRRWADLPQWKSLTRRHRNERRWLGQALENLATQRLIDRRVVTEGGKTWVKFSRGL